MSVTAYCSNGEHRKCRGPAFRVQTSTTTWTCPCECHDGVTLAPCCVTVSTDDGLVISKCSPFARGGARHRTDKGAPVVQLFLFPVGT